MSGKPSYEELEQRVKKLEEEATEYKQTERALRQERDKLQKYWQVAGAIFVVIDADQKVSLINKKGCEVLGYEANEIEGKNWFDSFLPERVKEDLRSGFIKLMAEPKKDINEIFEDGSENPIVTKGGKERIIAWRNAILKDKECNITAIMSSGEDVTEARRADKALRESENKYRTLLENIPQKIFHKDRHSVYVSCNENFARDLMIKPEDIAGKMDHDFFPKELVEKYRKDDTIIIETGKTEYIEEKYLQDGKEIFVQTVKTPIKDKEGHITGLLGIFWDITHKKKAAEALQKALDELEQRVEERTAELVKANQQLRQEIGERKRAEEAIHESEEKYRRLFDESIDAIYITSREGKFLDANQAALELFGYAREELINNINIRKLYIHPGDRDKFQQEIEGKGSVRNYPIEFHKKNGTGMNCLITTTLHVSSDGDILGYQGIIRDVTERELAEEALRESEKKYSTLVENSLTGIYIDQDEKIVFANNRFAEIYRYPKGQLIGIETWRLVHPEDRSLTKQMRARRLSGEDAPSEYEARGQTKDGETIWITRRNARIEYKGRAAILGNVVDITEQKQAEAELRKTNEELKNFVDAVSHDLKTPVIAIHGFASRLLKHYQEKLGDKGSRQLEQIMAGARRMELLVSDLLTFSRIGRIVPTFEHVASREIVRNVISGIQNRIKEKGIEVVVADNLPTIYCDGERIYQVFENLLVNATKFTADVKKPKIEIGYEDGGDLHLFYVRDNGIGIDPEHHLRIFEMFHRLRLKEDEEGTGLGLAIVDRIVKNHGGKVWVKSEKDKGATFYFTVPKRS